MLLPRIEDLFAGYDEGSLPPVELPDKWSGPRTYAEDFYAGGDQPAELLSTLTPFNLTPVASTPEEDDKADLVITPGLLTPSPESRENSISPAAEYNANDIEAEFDNATDAPQEGTPTFRMPVDDNDDGDGSLNSSVNISAPEERVTASPDLGDDTLAHEQPGEATHSPFEHEVSHIDIPHTPERNQAARAFLPHDRSLSPLRASPSGHIDWNWPPAFPVGRTLADRSPLKPPHTHLGGNEEIEVLEISEDEDEDEEQIGPMPLGTSDLEIPDNGLEMGESDDMQLEDPLEPVNSALSDFEVFTSQSQDLIPQPGPWPLPSTEPPFHDIPEEQQESIYAQLESIYMTNSSFEPEVALHDEDMLLEEHFEPLVIPGVGFGDLPPETVNREDIPPGFDLDLPDELKRQDEINATTQELDDTASARNTGEHIFLPSKPASESDVHLDADESRDPATGDNPYTVSEPGDDTRIPSEDPDLLTIVEITEMDVQIEESSYAVEEAVTEGRRTEVSN